MAAVDSGCAATVGGVPQRGKQTNTHVTAGRKRRTVNQETVEPSKTMRGNFVVEDAIVELADILGLAPPAYANWYQRRNALKVQSLYDLATYLSDLKLPMIEYAAIFRSTYEFEDYLDFADKNKKDTVIDIFFRE